MELLKALQFIIIAIILYAYNKPISKEIGRLMAIILKKLFPQGRYIVMFERFVVITSRFALYVGVIVTLISAIFKITGIN